MKTRQEIKREAKAILKENFKNIFVMFIPVFFLSMVTSGISFSVNSTITETTTEVYRTNFSIVPSIVTIIIGIFSQIVLLGIQDGILNKNYTIENSFKYFNQGTFKKAFIVSSLIYIFTLLWAFVPVAGVVLSIIKSLSYSLALFLILKQENFPSAKDYITRSKVIMNGHKMDMFIFGLSFLGWFFAIIFSFGLAAIWVIPYMNIATALYYDEIYNSSK